MSIWLMKSEPTEYSIEDLERDGSSSWFGVRNYQARNYMRDNMGIGDVVMFYHSNCKTPSIVGIAKVISLPHVDVTQFECLKKYYDPRATHEKPIWFCVDVVFITKIGPVTLTKIKETPELHSMKILQKGNRLSITPVTNREYAIIMQLCGK